VSSTRRADPAELAAPLKSLLSLDTLIVAVALAGAAVVAWALLLRARVAADAGMDGMAMGP